MPRSGPLRARVFEVKTAGRELGRRDLPHRRKVEHAHLAHAVVALPRDPATAAVDGVAGGAVTGYALHRATGGSSGGAAIGAAVGGAVVGTVVDAMVEDVYYSVITDIQIMERFDGTVREQSEHQLIQGDSGSTTSSYQRNTDMRKYQTRVVSFANQANLKWPEAEPELTQGMVRALAGLF